jgi:hypothetical protein
MHSYTTGYPGSNADLLICPQDLGFFLLATYHVVWVNLGGHGFTHHVVDALILVTIAPKHAKEASSIKTAQPPEEEVTKSSGVDSSFVGSSQQLAKNVPLIRALRCSSHFLITMNVPMVTATTKGVLFKPRSLGLNKSILVATLQLQIRFVFLRMLEGLFDITFITFLRSFTCKKCESHFLQADTSRPLDLLWSGVYRSS